MPPEKTDSDDSGSPTFWYEESLSLINPGTTVAKKGASNLPEQTWKPSLGILNLTMGGDEIWSYGNTAICRTYIAKERLSDFASDAVSVEIFQDGLIVLSIVRDVIRLIWIDHASAMEILRDVVPNIELPNAELRLLMQILSGVSLKEAAGQDGVSYETKRSQFKSLAARTGFRTQSEVIRQSLLALSMHVLDSVGIAGTNNLERPDEARAFLDLYYPDIFRFHKILASSGRVLRIAEAGPVTGMPVVFAHSQTLPHPGQFTPDWLERHQVRLIIPLRDGFLANRAQAQPVMEHLEGGAADMAEVIELVCGGRAKIVAQSTGTAYAVELARTRPELIEQMVLCASAYLGKYDNRVVGSVVRGFMNIAARSNLVLDQIYDRYVGRMSTPDGLRAVLGSAYKKSARDVEIFDAIMAGPLGHSWMLESYRLSRWSVINDVLMGSQDVWHDVDTITVPVLFLHGATDPVNAANDAREIQMRFANADFVELENEGQSLFLNRFEDIITRSADGWRADAA